MPEQQRNGQGELLYLYGSVFELGETLLPSLNASTSTTSNSARDGSYLSPSYIGSSRMDRPVPPVSPVPPGTPCQSIDPTYTTLSPKSSLLSLKNRSTSPATSQSIKHNINKHPLSSSARQRIRQGAHLL
ncbi:hypothetical protein TNCV_146011 [Trichonephila clavipes]|nr:hypothetical protein TNCV_146011 [Trichonephila clavipes]